MAGRSGPRARVLDHATVIRPRDGGVRVGELLDEVVFERKLRNLEAGYRARFGDLDYNVEDEIKMFKVGDPLVFYIHRRDVCLLMTCAGIPQNPETLRR